MTSSRSLRLTYAGISVFLSIFLSIVAVWLLTIALNDEQCKHFDREKVYKVGGVYFSEERDRFYDNRLQFTDYIGGKRTDEDYCLNIVDNWTIASGVALGAGIFQLLISAGYFHTVDSENPLGPRAWTVLWALCHLIFTGCCIAAFFVALSADVHRYHFHTRRAGPVFLAATAINAFLSLTLSILAFVFIMKRLNQEEEMYYEETKQDDRLRTPTPTLTLQTRPPSRQKFITDV